MPKKILTDFLLYPAIGLVVLMALWLSASALTYDGETGKSTLPGPAQTWQESKLYVLEPVAYRSEVDQGIVRMTWESLCRVLAGFGIAIAVAVPLGMALGSSAVFNKMIDPAIQVLRPVSPLAWYPIGYAIFMAYNKDWEINVGELAAIFTVAVCAMWPTVLNTAKGVRAIPQDYHNVAKVLGLSGPQKMFKVLLPAAFPDMFTGFRLSLGMAWLVIVAAEMLTGKSGIGGFLNQEFNAGKTEHILLCVITIGLVGFVLDRIMSLAEANTDKLLNLPFAFMAWVRSSRAGSASAAAGVPVAADGRGVAHAVP
jgi:nitrate/nitrite transport system permease protein